MFGWKVEFLPNKRLPRFCLRFLVLSCTYRLEFVSKVVMGCSLVSLVASWFGFTSLSNNTFHSHLETLMPTCPRLFISMNINKKKNTQEPGVNMK
jgi:hypothetical protein